MKFEDVAAVLAALLLVALVATSLWEYLHPCPACLLP